MEREHPVAAMGFEVLGKTFLLNPHQAYQTIEVPHVASSNIKSDFMKKCACLQNKPHVHVWYDLEKM